MLFFALHSTNGRSSDFPTYWLTSCWELLHYPGIELPVELSTTRIKDLPFRTIGKLSATERAALQVAVAEFNNNSQKAMTHIHGEFYFDISDSKRTRLKGGSHVLASKIKKHVLIRVKELGGDRNSLISKTLTPFEIVASDRSNFSVRDLDYSDPMQRLSYALGGNGDRFKDKKFAHMGPEDLVSFEVGMEGLREIKQLERLFSDKDFMDLGLSRTKTADRLYLAIRLDQENGFRMLRLGLDYRDKSDAFTHQMLRLDSQVLPTIAENGVIKFTYLRQFMQTDAWKNSIEVAKSGRAPVGAKTYFPHSWDDAKIKRAIGELLSSDSTVVLRSSVKSSGTSNFVLEGEFDGVFITIAILGKKVVSAYPSWMQERNAQLKKLWLERNELHEQIPEYIENLAMSKKMQYVMTPEQAIKTYLNEPVEVEGLSETENRLYVDAISPEFIQEANPGFSDISGSMESALRRYIFRYLEINALYERLVEHNKSVGEKLTPH